jgi:hypothetical protein
MPHKMTFRPTLENYFSYFTEIEERFLERRGGGLLLSTLDWALIETWKDAGIPLQAVLRGIDAAFDRYEQRPAKTRRVNSLAYCSQEVLSAAEDMKEAAVGAATDQRGAPPDRGFEAEAVAAFLLRNADFVEAAKIPQRNGVSAHPLLRESATTLRQLAGEVRTKWPTRLEDLERRLTVLEEKLLALLLTATPDEELVAIRAEADRDLAPFRRKMSAPQIEQLQKQYINERLLEKHHCPRLSLFYM